MTSSLTALMLYAYSQIMDLALKTISLIYIMNEHPQSQKCEQISSDFKSGSMLTPAIRAEISKE
jgi:hypothetical protein